MRRDGYDRGDRLRRWQPVQPFVLLWRIWGWKTKSRAARGSWTRRRISSCPGVGAFGDAMGKLASTGLVPELERQAENGKPLLGICLGMQLLFEKSYEYGEHAGLGLLPGSVCPLEPDPRGGGL